MTEFPLFLHNSFCIVFDVLLSFCQCLRGFIQQRVYVIEPRRNKGMSKGFGRFFKEIFSYSYITKSVSIWWQSHFVPYINTKQKIGDKLVIGVALELYTGDA